METLSQSETLASFPPASQPAKPAFRQRTQQLSLDEISPLR
ncbi:hypothetical protein CGRA01v4_06745 [Colletotrichum graminicola]|nr:hypothetical protein CGRA01v4_06745 [Colletotrichum graminicola]